MISVVILVLITGAMFLSINSALDSWSYSREQLCLQKVLADTMNQIINGTHKRYGLKDSLEIISAEQDAVEFVPPWVDDTHNAAGKDFIYSLNRSLKAATGLPAAQVRLSESGQWVGVPVKIVELEDTDEFQVRLGIAVDEGSDLRFIYHPDAEKEPDVIHKIYWDAKLRQIFLNDNNEVENISQNSFGVEITQMTLNFFTASNEMISERGSVETERIQMITSVEVTIEAKLNDQTQTLVNFVNLRNAPVRRGFYFLQKGTRIQIPNSKDIHSLTLSNISGVSNEDQIQFEAVPEKGPTWRLRVVFEKIGLSKPRIKMYTIEYPAQKIVYSDYPRIYAENGLNLMALGGNGLFDYDDDADIEDTVLLEGKVELLVSEMDVKGAGLFVKP